MTALDATKIVGEYRDLTALGLRAFRDPNWRAANEAAKELFYQRPDTFVRVDGSQFRALFPTHEPPTALASLRFINNCITSEKQKTYIPLSLIKPPLPISDDAIDKATQVLSTQQTVMIRGVRLNDGSIDLFENGHAYYYAALARGDTHLLITLEERKINVVLPDCASNTKSRSKLLREQIEHRDKDIFEKMIFETCRHPKLLRELFDLGAIREHPQRNRALFYIYQIIKNAFLDFGRLKSPTETVVGMVGYGKDTRLISTFLNLGYQVVAVEDFQDSKHDNGNQESLLRPFDSYRSSRQLQCFDFRNSHLPKNSCDVILTAAVIDPMIDTLLHLTKPNGYVAATEMGQVGTERINNYVEDPQSWASYASQRGFNYQDIYSDILNGHSPLPSDYINARGTSCYLVQRLS